MLSAKEKMQLWLGVKADWGLTHFWRYLRSLVVNVEVRVFDILMHKPSVLKGIHEAGSARAFLGIPVDAKIMLSSIMPDRNLDRLHAENYLPLINAVKPDLATSIEIPLYDGHGRDLLQFSKEKFVNHLIELKKHISCDIIVVLIPGRSPQETEWFAQKAYSLGFRKMGLPCADSMQRNKRYCVSQIHSDLRVLKKYSSEIYLFGLTSPKNIEEFSYADHVVTRGWYHAIFKFKQELSLNGFQKAVIQPIFNKNQQIFNADGSLHQGDTKQMDKQRMRQLQILAVKAIKTLFTKIFSIKKQQSLEEYAQWSQKEAVIPDQATVPTLTVDLEESEGIRA